MRRLYVMLLLVAMGFSCVAANGTGERKKKKDDAKESVKKEGKYEEFLKKPGRITVKGGLTTVYRIVDGQEDKIYLEFPLKHLGREVLLGATVAASSDPMTVDVGYKYLNPLHLTFEIRDSSVLLNIPNSGASLGTEETWAQKAYGRNYMTALYKRYPIMAYNADSTAVLFEVTDLFYNNPAFALNEYSMSQMEFSSIENEKENEKAYFGKIKVFEDNLSVELNQRLAVKSGDLDLGKTSCRMNISMLLLPENKMRPRIQDSRVGVFPSASPKGRSMTWKFDLSQKEDGMRPYMMAARWRLVPKDEAAWKRGELVEPLKPIVWYVDDAFPEEWKAPIKKGVLVWNQAFEKIGFKNVMQVKDFPLADTTFDPDNLKYSCIRYAPVAVANAMGPSWVDPITGEIVNASVIVYNDIIKLVNNWRFVQTAQVDPRVRAKKMPQDVWDESLVYVIAHEIGHTLGLMHNMGSSSAFPVDSLRSISFTQKYGTTPSIMDYARHNYVAQPEDKGVKLTPPDLGVYDEYVIKWLYTPIPEAKDMWEEGAIAEKWIDEKAGDPLYRYGRQQVFNVVDPTSQSEDLGDDPLKSGEYGIKNLKYILQHLNEWITDDADLRYRKEIYYNIVNQYFRYLFFAVSQIGGMELTQVKDGTKGKPVKVLDKETQRKAVAWVLNELHNSDWINAPELTKKFNLQAKSSLEVNGRILMYLIDKMPSVSLASHVAGDEGYKLREYFDDLYKELFASTIQGKRLTEMERSMQKFFVMHIGLYYRVAFGQLVSHGITGFTPSLEDIRSLGLINMSDQTYSRLKEMESRNGEKTVAYALLRNHFGEAEWPFSGEVNSLFMADRQSEIIPLVKKIRTLVQSKLATVHPDDKGHYEYVLAALESKK